MVKRRASSRDGSGGRKLLALVLLVPFLALSLLKPGTMLAPDAQGRMMVVLCGDSVPVEMAVAADGTLIPVAELPAHAGDHQPCGWAPHAQPLLAAAAAGPGLPLRRAGAPDRAPSRVAALSPAPPPPPLARGPPPIL